MSTGLFPVQGSNDNEYLLEIQPYRPDACPACGGERLHNHDDYWRYGLTQRFRCARVRCRQVFSVLPSYLEPGQSYTTAVEELAVETYAAGTAPLVAVADMVGVGTTTLFRWVDRACEASSGLVGNAAAGR